MTTIAKPEPTPAMLAGGRGLGASIETLDEGLAEYTTEQADILRWWFETAIDHSWNLSELANRTGVSSTSLSRLFRGKYGANPDSSIERLAVAKETFNASADNPDFIMTSLAKQVFAIADKTREMRNVTLMYGPMGIGKTVIQEEYQRLNNHGRTYYFRCPGYGPSLPQFVKDMSTQLRLRNMKNTHDMRHRITAYLSRGQRLLMIDELHQIFLNCEAKHIKRIMEWIRQLYDQADCGIILTGTKLIQHEFFEGDYADVLGQLTDRGTLEVELSAKPTKSDIIAFLKHYGLKFPEAGTEAHAILNDIIGAHGLRKLTQLLRAGVAHAIKQSEAYTWDHFVTSFQGIQTLRKRR